MAPLVNPAALRAFFAPARGSLSIRPYLIVAAAGIVAGAAAGLSPPGSRIDWALYDQFTRRLIAGERPAPGLVVVAIDEPSLAEIGIPFPWPRALHAALVDRLAGAGARTIAFDVLFDLPAANHEDDEALADAIRRAGTVVLATDQAVIEDRGYALTQWTDPIPILGAAAAAQGVIRIPFDPDNVLRRAWLEVSGRPALAAAVAMREPGMTVQADEGTARLIRFNGLPRQGIVTVSYYQALDAAALPADLFKDKHVLVGRSLAATTIDNQVDHFTTPVSPQMAGVEIHATIVDAILRDRFIADPLRSGTAALALSLVAGAVVAAALFGLGPLPGVAIAIAVVGAIGAAGYAALANGVRLPVVAPALAVIGGYGATAAYRFALVSRERRMIKRAFQHYVAPAIVEQMLADPSKLKLGGTEYDVTVLFSDLEGFTTLSERLDARALSAELGEYFTQMLDVLLPERGTLDKLIGDAIMMYFGCPILDEQHAFQACRGALAMQRQMVSLNARLNARGLPALRTRIGINSGRVVAGNMGTGTIFNYTIIGDAVNLAARLEGVNKEYGSLIIVGEDTRQRVGAAFEMRELDWIRVKGKQRPVAIYELAGEAGALTPERREQFARYAQALASYRDGRWQDAVAGFDSVLSLNPDDGPSRVLASRCAAFAASPPATWDGVHEMKSK